MSQVHHLTGLYGLLTDSTEQVTSDNVQKSWLILGQLKILWVDPRRNLGASVPPEPDCDSEISWKNTCRPPRVWSSGCSQSLRPPLKHVGEGWGKGESWLCVYLFYNSLVISEFELLITRVMLLGVASPLHLWWRGRETRSLICHFTPVTIPPFAGILL